MCYKLIYIQVCQGGLLGSMPNIHSRPFFIGTLGYKVCVRFYPVKILYRKKKIYLFSWLYNFPFTKFCILLFSGSPRSCVRINVQHSFSTVLYWSFGLQNVRPSLSKWRRNGERNALVLVFHHYEIIQWRFAQMAL